RILRNVADPAALGRQVHGSFGVEDRLAGDRDPAGRFPQPGDRLQQRGLPGARRAQDGDRARLESGSDLQDEAGQREPDVELDQGAPASRFSRRLCSNSVTQTVTKAIAATMPTSRKAASSWPIWVRWKIASASVCVRPGMFPATRIVAPNSPSAREKASSV